VRAICHTSSNPVGSTRKINRSDQGKALADIAQLDAATPLAPVYPNWFIDRLTDQQIAQTLGGNAR
jgi:hypothetical protein